jgi:glycosyltransferase involved in cell wall biosynthesis
MKIALVTCSFLPEIGGASYVVHHLAQQWAIQGHEICVINATSDRATEPGALYTVKKYSVHRGSSRFGEHSILFLWYYRKVINKLLADFNPDYISGHFAYPVAIWLSMIKPLRKFLITCHGSEIEKSQRPRNTFNVDALLAEALNKSHGVVAISKHQSSILHELGVNSSKVHYIPNGVDTKRFGSMVKFDLRARFGIPGDAMVILSVGSGRPIKSFDAGIKAFVKLHMQLSNTYYVIIGRNTDKWFPLAQELGVAENVIFCDGLYGDELIGAYQQADIFFSPSIQEGCPLVVLEAMASGLPVLATDISGSQDLIKTGINGIVVKPGNVDEMASALYRIAGDTALRKQFSSANAVKAISYDWYAVSSRYLELMKSP